MAIVQAEPLEVAGDYDGVGIRCRVGVSLGAGYVTGSVTISPVDGDTRSADG